ncbi:MAG: outer membrane beta-barrel protein, partial [Desulfobacteraceae bacterium]|nr:outer membrane beta-barrel protein [Desulfobacteraceae bacterium]
MGHIVKTKNAFQKIIFIIIIVCCPFNLIHGEDPPPSEQDVIFIGPDTATEEQGIIPFIHDGIPADKVIIIDEQKTPPKSADDLPGPGTGSGIRPEIIITDPIDLPEGQDIRPNEEEKIPREKPKMVIPKGEEVLPDGTIVFPIEPEAITTDQYVLPDGQDAIPELQEILPDGTLVFPIDTKNILHDQNVIPGSGQETGTAGSDVIIPGGQAVIPSGQESLSSDQQAQGTFSGETGVGAKIFGIRGGYIHPVLLLDEKYTDNIFSTNTGEKEDFITSITTGIGLAFPGTRENLISVNTGVRGVNLRREEKDAARYQTYLLYFPEFVFYSEHSDQDHINHRLEALAAYHFGIGLSIKMADVFNIRDEINSDGVTEELSHYMDNDLLLMVSYDPSHKFQFRLDLNRYDMDFESEEESFQDRQDTGFQIYAYYKYSPKTSFFIEYDFMDVKFSNDTIYNNTEHRYFGGIEWEFAARRTGSLKLGWIDKNFSDSSVNDQNGFSIEGELEQEFTPKRTLNATIFRRFQETDTIDSSGFMETGIDLGFNQRFSKKWTGTINAGYKWEDYNGINRTDKVFNVGPAIRFSAKNWLIFDL